jgi:predicted  nucleic acid-binding Zn-ribbon protein
MSAQAQDAATVDQRVEALRAQLRGVTDRQAQLQTREQQLDEDLKPENIEHSLAGVGTTDAAALCDRHRQQLEKEKAGVEEQLQGLAESRSRLEAAISTAEAEAVRLRAASLNANSAPQRTGATAAPASRVTPSKPKDRRAARRRHKTTRRRRS